MLINGHDPMIESTLIENQAEIAELSRFARGVVVDVGANVGSHSINFAKTAEVVYAFEPQPLSYYTLCANLLLNHAYNVAPFNRALGAYDGTAMMPNLDPTKQNTAMGAQVGVGAQPVPICKLDSLEIAPIHFIKIDVECYEYEVLKGAVETLKRENPVVYVEVHRDDLVAPIDELMKGLGYHGATLFEVLTSRQIFEDSKPSVRYHTLDLEQRDEYHRPDVNKPGYHVYTETEEDSQYHIYPEERVVNGGMVVLTTGHLYWKEGRIQWIGP
jgi:FkbM family methyltransferase